MSNPKLAADAIKKMDNHSANEKLILSFLCNKQILGEKTSSAWRPLEEFIKNFEYKWSSIKDILDGTRLTPVKLERTLTLLAESGYIKVNKVDKKFGKKKKFAESEVIPKENIYSITTRVFEDYRDGTKENLQKTA